MNGMDPECSKWFVQNRIEGEILCIIFLQYCYESLFRNTNGDVDDAAISRFLDLQVAAFCMKGQFAAFLK